MISSLLVVPITVIAPAQVSDRYGVERHSYDEADGATREATSGWISQRVSDQSETISTDALLFVSPDTDITQAHRVEVDGMTWDVIGEPLPARGRAGRVHHPEAVLRVVTER